MWLEGEMGVAPQLLDTDLTLKDNLSNKTLTEFPVLHVMTKGAGPLTARTRPLTETVELREKEETKPEKEETKPGKLGEGKGEGSRMYMCKMPFLVTAAAEGDPCATQCKSEGEWSGEDGECQVNNSSASLSLIADTYSDSEDGIDS